MNVLQFIKERMKSGEYKPNYVTENTVGHEPRRTRGGKNRGIGFTRKSHEQSKVRRKMERASRKINYRFAKRKK